MSNLDKKIISILLIVSMFLISLSTVVKATDDNEEVNLFADNSNPALKTNTESANLYWDHVLTASGDLYCINYSKPTQKMNKVDSNVSKYIYNSTGLYLKGNTAVLVDGEKTIKKVNNVKDIGTSLYKSAYLTTNNELYTISNNGETQKIDTGVSSLIGSAFYYKDGKTYSITGKLVYTGKIDSAYAFQGAVFAVIGSQLYLLDPSNVLYPQVDNFSSFEYNNFQNPTDIVLKNGQKKELYYLHSYGSKYQLERNHNVIYNQKTIMTNVKMASYGYEKEPWELYLRTDGSVWARTDAGTFCVLENTKKGAFSDVSTSSWYYNAVKYVFDNNIIKGYDNTTFAPNDNLTRGMLATILYRMEGEPAISGKPKFPDVQDSKQFYYKAVKWATDKGVVAGYNTGKFGPNDNITREQLAVILNRYAKYKGKNVSATNDLKKFSDVSKISDYAVSSMKWAVGAGVITGNDNGTLNPKGNATRAEVSAMMEKYCKKVGR